MAALLRVYSVQCTVTSLLLIAGFFIFTPKVFAATDNFAPLTSSNYNDSVNTDRFYRNQMVTMYHVLYGVDPFGAGVYSEKLYTSKTEGGQTKVTSIAGLSTGNTEGGALGMAGKTIAYLYTPPTSSVEYLANFGENIGFSPKKAYAQNVTGSGNNVISPVLGLWQVMRNIAYVAFILVFVVTGLMIMFRQKLNPQTVIGVQQALPGLVIGLVLITFSYFIAAFIVDLSFVGMRLVTEIFISTGQSNFYGCTNNPLQACSAADNKTGLLNTYQNSDAFSMYGQVATNRSVSNAIDFFGAVWGTVGANGLVSNNLTLQQRLVEAMQINPMDVMFGPLGLFASFGSTLLGINIQQAIAGVTIATLAALLLPIILAIALLIQFIRLIIALLMSYIQILIMVIAGPLFILISAIPGRGGILSYWLKSLLANVLIFPAVFAGFLFAGMLLNYDWKITASMPLFGGLGTDIIKPLLAFGILLGLPSIPEMVRGAFGIKGPQGFTQAALGGFMGGFNVGKSGVTMGYAEGMKRKGIATEQAAREKQRIEEAQGTYAGNAEVPGLRGWLIRHAPQVR